uniref:Uncharacterized protein n=1 Tax=Periophthalmus magnuspinnatus TaxID=409849 RepID=A0A3B4AH67_9GOBI
KYEEKDVPGNVVVHPPLWVRVGQDTRLNSGLFHTYAHRFDKGHVAVETDQSQEEDAADVVHGDGDVDHFAEEFSKVPLVPAGDGECPKGEEGHQNEVGQSQVPQVDVSHAAGLPLEAEDQEHQEVPQQTHGRQQAQEGGHQ